MSQPVKMDLIKKLLPKKKTIQTFKDTQGFRITINENPHTQIFFLNFFWAFGLEVQCFTDYSTKEKEFLAKNLAISYSK